MNIDVNKNWVAVALTLAAGLAIICHEGATAGVLGFVAFLLASLD